jgi:ferredoxin
MPKKEKSTFSHFFKEDAENIQDIIHPNTEEQVSNKVGLVNKEEFPKISPPKAISADELKVKWQNLRSFFRNANNVQGLSDDLWPVIMAPQQNEKMVAVDFPFWVTDENFDGEGAYCSSLKEILIQSLDKIGQGEKDALILKTNIDRILHIANNHLADKKPQLFQPAIHQILDELDQQLAVSGEDAELFKNELKKLKETLPQSGVLLPYSINTAFQLLEGAMFTIHAPARKKLSHDTSELKSKLQDLLRIEKEKGPERKNPDSLRDSLSFVDSMVKFDELSSLLPEAGSELMGAERVERIVKVLRDLEETETVLNQQGFLFVDELLYGNQQIAWKNLFEKSEVAVFQKGKGCDAISSAFELHINSCTKFFIAKRIGELELENNYQADIHDEYFKHFNWQSFSSDELNNCPYFILIIDDQQLFNAEFNKLSTMLSDNIPVKIVAIKRTDYIDYNQNGLEKGEQTLHTQAELGALMLSYKNIYVSQSASITPKYLFDGFTEGLSAFAPAFFHVLNITEQIHENPFVWISASIEGRDFPGFTFKGLLGTPWGSRFEVNNNPQPTLAWPMHSLEVIDEIGNKKEMQFPFTFADLAVLNPAYHHYYLPVDSSLWNDDLIPLTVYMKNKEEENISKIPFIWMLDATNELHKVAVSWPIVIATQERLDFWRFLQENSGINNYHVTQAVEQIKTEMKAVFTYEIDQMKGGHELEIQKIREEEAGKVMENLTSVLLDLDTTNIHTSSIPASSPEPSPEPKVAPEEVVVKEVPVKKVEEESLLSNDPYIDTALCTTCNECTGINGAMFKYNADKLAYIDDAKAGTFKQLVEAAELCPVGIIHPGSPLNPNEPDLDNLIKRAEKFN